MERILELLELLESIDAHLRLLTDKIDHTNEILKRGVKTQWGHELSKLDMDPDRFQKSEQMRNLPPK